MSASRNHKRKGSRTPHQWVKTAVGIECRMCAMRSTWPGAKDNCAVTGTRASLVRGGIRVDPEIVVECDGPERGLV